MKWGGIRTPKHISQENEKMITSELMQEIGEICGATFSDPRDFFVPGYDSRQQQKKE